MGDGADELTILAAGASRSVCSQCDSFGHFLVLNACATPLRQGSSSQWFARKPNECSDRPFSAAGMILELRLEVDMNEASCINKYKRPNVGASRKDIERNTLTHRSSSGLHQEVLTGTGAV